MSHEHELRALKIFEGALELEPAARAAFLESSLAGAPELRRRVEALFAAQSDLDSFLARPAAQDRTEEHIGSSGEPLAGAPPPVNALPGYRLLKEIHRGGQGVVYQAIQESARRKVAVKVLLEGPFASRDARRRFEREIALVASLRHPGIVPVFDSGVTEGKHWYAMEYIRGEPLDVHVRRRDLSVGETLRIFTKVCGAVDYAHQRGVIHRDLKPSNILVDDRGDPHVLDFGLAKIGGAEVEDGLSLLVSVTGQVMGTLPYMSPEQAAGRSDQVDLRSDVYALGVVLYELLTREYPYPVTGQVADVLRNIQDFAPRRPSSIRRQVNDEVETIVLKALSKEKARRYATAGGLGEDVERFLRGEPIEAKRDSALYILRKTLGRYRVAASVAVGFVVLITFAAAALWVLYSEKEIERQRVVKAEAEANQRAAEAQTLARQKERARREVELQLRRATAERIAAQAQASRTTAPVQSLLLATEAVEATRKSEEGLSRSAYESLVASLATVGGEPVVSPAEDVEHVAVVPGADRVVTVTRAGDGYLRDLADSSNASPVAVFRGAEEPIRRLAVTPDGRWLVTGHAGGTVRCWDLRAPDPSRSVIDLGTDGRALACLGVSPDGRWLASGSLNRRARLWRLRQGDPLAETVPLSEHSISVTRLDFSPDGRWLATAGRGATVRLWDLAGSLDDDSTTLEAGAEQVKLLSFGPTGRTLVTADRDQSVRVWDLTVDPPDQRLLVQHPLAVEAIAISPDGRWLATGCDDHIVRLCDLHAADRGKQIIMLTGHRDEIWQLKFSHDGRWLISGSDDATLGLWDLSREHPATRHAFLRGHAGRIRVLEVGSDGWVVSLSQDGTVRRWDLESALSGSGYPIVATDIEYDSYYAIALAFSADGRWLASGDNGQSVRLWRLSSGNPVRNPPELLLRHDHRVHHVAFSRPGRWLFSASERRIYRWDLSSLPPSSKWALESDSGTSFTSLAVGPNERWLYAGHSDGTISRHDLAPKPHDPRASSWSSGTGSCNSLALSPRGAWLFAANAEGTVCGWDLRQEEPAAARKTFAQRAAAAVAVAVSHDGRWLATSFRDAALWLYDLGVNENEPTYELGGHDGLLGNIVFGSHGNWLCASGDRVLYLWDRARLDRAPFTIRGHVFGALAASPDGAWLASGGRVRAPRLWNLDTDFLLDLARRKAGRQLTPRERTIFDLDRLR